jgi:hypothetical protein
MAAANQLAACEDGMLLWLAGPQLPGTVVSRRSHKVT